MLDDNKPQVVGRIYRETYGCGTKTHGALNSVGRELPDGAPLYAEQVSKAAREVLQELLDDVEEAIIATSNAVGKGTLRIDGVPLNPAQEAERLSGLCLKRRRIMDVLK